MSLWQLHLYEYHGYHEDQENHEGSKGSHYNAEVPFHLKCVETINFFCILLAYYIHRQGVNQQITGAGVKQ